VRDLKYIAEQAKLLLPMHDPSPKVWIGIEQSLQRQGLLTEGRMSRQGHTTNYSTQTKSWTPIGWIIASIAVVVFTAMLVTYKPHLPSTQDAAQNSSAQSAQFDNDDQQLIARVSEQEPGLRRAYEDGLKEANAYIADAQQEVKRDPDDASAQEQLVQAYQQKETLYQLATARSLP
jgi:hypothetical protein